MRERDLPALERTPSSLWKRPFTEALNSLKKIVKEYPALPFVGITLLLSGVTVGVLERCGERVAALPMVLVVASVLGTAGVAMACSLGKKFKSSSEHLQGK